MSKSIKLKDNCYLDSSSISNRGNGFDFNGTNNKMKFGSDSSNWLPTRLAEMGMKKIFSSVSKENPTDEGEFGIAYKNTFCYPFTDGAFYQGTAGNKVLDESIIEKIWEDTNINSWEDGNLGVDISPYKFVIICASHMSTIVPTQYLGLNLTWNGWYEPISKDADVVRQIWRDGNDIHWGPCYYRCINGFTGFGQINDINYPKVVYGIKI